MSREFISPGFTNPEFINSWFTSQKSTNSGFTDSEFINLWFTGLKSVNQKSNN
jgi:hypothetical protein